MAPVTVFKLKPVGKTGFTEYEVATPPLLLAVLVIIALPGQ